MSPRRIPNQRMKYWGFYASEELKAETIKCAEAANESDSEYIRRAVEQRNNPTTTVHHDFIARHEKNKIEHPEMFENPVTQQDSTHNTAPKPTIPEPKEKGFRSFPKGGK